MNRHATVMSVSIASSFDKISSRTSSGLGRFLSSLHIIDFTHTQNKNNTANSFLLKKNKYNEAKTIFKFQLFL